MSASALAEAWESVQSIRRKTVKLEAVSCVGKSVTRDTLTENKQLLLKAIEMLGLRVTVSTCQVHLESLYKLMYIPCPSTTIEVQGWVLRRCLTQVNHVCGRTHRPRDPNIRELCAAAGTTWPEPDPTLHSTGSYTDFEDFEEEECESEAETEDEEVPAPGGEETMNGALGLPAPNASTSTIEAGTSMALPPSANPSSSPTLENQVTPESKGQNHPDLTPPPVMNAEKKRAQQLEMLAGLQTQLDQLTKLQKLHCQRSKPIHVGEALPFSGLHPDLVETQPMDLDAFMLGTPYDAEIKQVQAALQQVEEDLYGELTPTASLGSIWARSPYSPIEDSPLPAQVGAMKEGANKDAGGMEEAERKDEELRSAKKEEAAESEPRAYHDVEAKAPKESKEAMTVARQELALALERVEQEKERLEERLKQIAEKERIKKEAAEEETKMKANSEKSEIVKMQEDFQRMMIQDEKTEDKREIPQKEKTEEVQAHNGKEKVHEKVEEQEEAPTKEYRPQTKETPSEVIEQAAKKAEEDIANGQEEQMPAKEEEEKKSEVKDIASKQEQKEEERPMMAHDTVAEDKREEETKEDDAMQNAKNVKHTQLDDYKDVCKERAAQKWKSKEDVLAMGYQGLQRPEGWEKDESLFFVPVETQAPRKPRGRKARKKAEKEKDDDDEEEDEQPQKARKSRKPRKPRTKKPKKGVEEEDEQEEEEEKEDEPAVAKRKRKQKAPEQEEAAEGCELQKRARTTKARAKASGPKQAARKSSKSAASMPQECDEYMRAVEGKSTSSKARKPKDGEPCPPCPADLPDLETEEKDEAEVEESDKSNGKVRQRKKRPGSDMSDENSKKKKADDKARMMDEKEKAKEEQKKRNSKRSCAYVAARRRALSSGATEEEAKELVREAYKNAGY